MCVWWGGGGGGGCTLSKALRILLQLHSHRLLVLTASSLRSQVVSYKYMYIYISCHQLIDISIRDLHEC